MNVKIQSRNFDLMPNLQRLIERKAQKVAKILPTFTAESLTLHLTIEKLPRGNQYETALVLTTPQTSIRVAETEDNPSGSVLRGYDELIRKIQKFKSQLTRERFWQRQPEWAQRGPAESAQDLEKAINQSLDKIQNYIRRELYHQTLHENLPIGLLQPEALTDEVFLEASAKAAAKPLGLSFEQWIIQLAREHVAKRIAGLDRESPHLEEAAPTDAARWEDEPLNFYQPDESLSLGDLLPDITSGNPEELLEREEAEKELHEAVARLPKSIRESFVLNVLEGFAPDEATMITGRAPETIAKDVEIARNLLRDSLLLMRPPEKRVRSHGKHS
jgi:DNA-directed RNA polymerase specialized sigma24 family protein